MMNKFTEESEQDSAAKENEESSLPPVGYLREEHDNVGKRE